MTAQLPSFIYFVLSRRCFFRFIHFFCNLSIIYFMIKTSFCLSCKHSCCCCTNYICCSSCHVNNS